MRSLLAAGKASWILMLAVGILAPVAAVTIVLGLGSRNLPAATSLCLLAVVIAGAVAGRGSGIIASFLSFVGLNFFFTEPHHTLAVREATDVVALIAFLLSGLIVGGLVSRVREERARAERRATESQLLSKTTEQFISRAPLSLILDGLAEALLRLFDLIRCEIATPDGMGQATSGDPDTVDGHTISIPLVTRSGTSGALTAVRAAGAEPFSSSELGLMKTLAGQTAMAIERITLDGEVQAARLEAEASALRAALFSSVTHDLKTPLASIKASASGLLAEGARYTEAERRDVLRDVVHEADHLNLIVGNLLDLARIRAGALVPSKQPILIDEVIGSVLQRMRRALDGVVVRTTIRRIFPRSTPIPSRSVKCSRTSSRTRSGSLRPGPRSGSLPLDGTRRFRCA